MSEPAKDFVGQHEGEKVEFVFRQHPIVLRKNLLAAVLVFGASSLPLGLAPQWVWSVRLLIVGAALALLISFYRWLGWYFSVYIATSERLIQIKQRGFFDRRVVDISLENTQGVNYEIKGVQATLFHYGTIILKTFVGDVVLDYIHNPAEIQRQLANVVRELQPNEPNRQPAESETE